MTKDLKGLSTATIRLRGVCWDDKSSFMQGAAEAPPLIREAFHSPSANYFAEDGTDTRALFEDLGDDSFADYGGIRPRAELHLADGHRLLTLGGDHSITYPIIQAYAEKYPGFHILQIDAHGDLYDEFEGDRFSHACPFARIMEEQLTPRLIQVGIRTLSTHQRQQAQTYGVEVHEMKDGPLSEISLGDHPLYISLDMDAFDPAYAPGVSHHEPGGLTAREVLNFLQRIKAPIVGADIVEYNPRRDVQGMTAMLAAKMMKELLAMMHKTTLAL
ncbi:MAG: agmatinase [Bacteroidota bacterium]